MFYVDSIILKKPDGESHRQDCGDSVNVDY